MHKNVELLTLGFIAGDLMVAKRFVKWGTTAGEVVQAGPGDRVLGVLLGKKGETFAAGKPVQVLIMGITDLEAGGALNQGDLVGAGAAGVAAAITLGVASATPDLAGEAFETVTTAGDLVAVWLNRNPIAVNA